MLGYTKRKNLFLAESVDKFSQKHSDLEVTNEFIKVKSLSHVTNVTKDFVLLVNLRVT